MAGRVFLALAANSFAWSFEAKPVATTRFNDLPPISTSSRRDGTPSASRRGSKRLAEATSATQIRFTTQDPLLAGLDAWACAGAFSRAAGFSEVFLLCLSCSRRWESALTCAL